MFDDRYGLVSLIDVKVFSAVCFERAIMFLNEMYFLMNLERVCGDGVRSVNMLSLDNVLFMKCCIWLK